MYLVVDHSSGSKKESSLIEDSTPEKDPIGAAQPVLSSVEEHVQQPVILKRGNSLVVSEQKPKSKTMLRIRTNNRESKRRRKERKNR